MKKIFSIIILIVLVQVARGQETDSTQSSDPAIMALAKSYGDSIVLRWAPSTSALWAIANQYGYIIERLSYMKPEDFDPGQYQRLTPDPVKPWPLKDWESIATPDKNNPLAAVAAQCIHGEHITIGKKGASYFQQANELANRWTFTLLAADISPVTAKASGMRFTDTDISSQRTYVYRIYTPVPKELYEVDTAYVVVNPAERVPIPRPVIGHATELEGKVNLEWDREAHRFDFTAFYIERSADGGKTFRRLTDLPFVSPPSQDSALQNPSMVYTDSVGNYIPYHYRIIGITPFGDVSEPSESIQAMGRDRTPPPAPVNLKATSLGGSRVSITWDMPELPEDMEGYYIGRSDNALNGFEPLHETALSPETGSFVDEYADPLKANFYVVASKDTAGNGQVSMATYGIIVDSLPPAPPQGLYGKVDTNGVVTLTWHLGSEPDIIGYEVFYANAADHVFARITPKPWQDTTYRDTIMVKTLTEKVYYRVVAVDANFNYSSFSETLELSRPDLIPPTAPVFSDYKVGDGFVDINWIPSSSEDVSMHVLFRRKLGEDWEQIAVIMGQQPGGYHRDTTVSAGENYEYSIRAIDDAGLISEEAYTLYIKAVDMALKPPVRNLRAVLDARDKEIELSWEYPYQGKFRYAVYRAVNGSNFISMANITDNNLILSDQQIRPGVEYEYTIRVIYPDGKQSGFSPQVKVRVE